MFEFKPWKARVLGVGVQMVQAPSGLNLPARWLGFKSRTSRDLDVATNLISLEHVMIILIIMTVNKLV